VHSSLVAVDPGAVTSTPPVRSGTFLVPPGTRFVDGDLRANGRDTFASHPGPIALTPVNTANNPAAYERCHA
jgi:hypothetical protein